MTEDHERHDEIERLLLEALNLFLEHPVEMDSELLGRLLSVRIQTEASDMGRIVGDHGGMIKALQGIFAQIGETVIGQPVKIKILEPKPGEKKHYPPFRQDPNWPKERIEKFFRDVMTLSTLYSWELEIHDGAELSSIQITVDEEDEIPEEFDAHLLTLATAIGKANGRVLHVALEETVNGNK